MTPALTALVLYAAGLLLAFGLRSMVQRRTTGDSGFRHPLRSPVGSAPWWSQILFVVALVSSAAAPVLVLAGALVPPQPLSHPAAVTAGIVLAVIGFGGLLVAQLAMGPSWRIGVDPEERTELVNRGVFALVRNPIFTAMVVAMLGLTLLVPVWLQLLALAAVIAGVQIQVRAIEEPYLLRTHGPAYRQYAARTGRFVPGVGRLVVPGGARDTSDSADSPNRR